MNPYMQYAEKLSQNEVRETTTWEFEEMTDFKDNSLHYRINRVPEKSVQYQNIRVVENIDEFLNELMSQVKSEFEKPRRTHIVPYPYTVPTEVKEKYSQKGIDLVEQSQKQ